jgi:hypothetical protein
MDKELQALYDSVNKAYQTTSNAPNIMQITPDPEIHSKTVEETSFLSFLRMQNREEQVNTSKVSFIEETPGNTASVIAETGDIPDYAVTAYTEHPETMRTIATGFKVSFMAQMGTTARDILQAEIARGYTLVNNKMDYLLLNGDSSQNALEFDSIWSDDAVNTTSLNGDALSEDAIDDLLGEIKNEGGSPDVIVTDSFVAKQLKKIAAPYRRYNDKIDIGLGFKVITYESLNGRELTILVDENVPTTTTGSGASATTEHAMLALDSSTIKIKTLLPPSLFDLPSSNLSYNKAVATFTVAHNLAPWKNGAITGIGAGE